MGPCIAFLLSEPAATWLTEAAVAAGMSTCPLEASVPDAIEHLPATCRMVVLDAGALTDPAFVVQVHQWCLADARRQAVAVVVEGGMPTRHPDWEARFDRVLWATDPANLRSDLTALPQEIPRREALWRRISQASAAAQFRSADYARILDVLVEGVVYQDANDSILYANGAASRILGLTPEQLQGKTSFDSRWQARNADGRPMRPEEHPSFVTLRSGQPVRDFPMQICHASGEVRDILVNAQPVPNPAGGLPDAVVVSFRDLTAANQAARDLDDLRQRLAQAQKLEALGRLTAGIAHDFNNLLTPILAQVQLLSQDVLTDPAHRRLNMIEHNALAARDLVAQILNFSAQRPPRQDPVPVAELLRAVLEPIRDTAPASVVIGHGPVPAVSIRGDRLQLEQALMNLLSNALKAVEGSAAPRVTLDAAVIEDAARTMLALRVKDNGRGMTPAVRERIFEPFFTTVTDGRGTGLGLFLIRNVVRAHGGRVTVDSVPGTGTTFTLILPLADPVPQEIPLTSVAVAPTFSGTALVVDDNRDGCVVVQEMLRTLGLDCHGYVSAQAALQAVESGQVAPDILVTDFAMPGMDGSQLAAAIKRRSGATRTLIVTGYGEDLSRLAPATYDLTLRKPFTLAELRSAIERLRN